MMSGPELIMPSRFRRNRRVELVGTGMGGAGAMGVSLAANRAKSSPAWSPASLSGLALWVRSDLGVTAPGNVFSQWADQSGQGNHLVPGRSAPALSAAGGVNGKPAATFTGTQEFTCASPSAMLQTQTASILAVYKTGATIAQFAVGLVFANHAWTMGYGLIQYPGTTGLQIWRQNYITSACAGVIAANTAYAALGQTSNPAQSIDINGTTSTGSSAVGASFTTVFLYVGNSPDGAPLGPLSELIVRNVMWSAPEIASFNGYSTPRYGVSL